MNNITFYKIVILILIVLNLGTIAFIWFGRRDEGRDGHRGKTPDRMVRELGLDARQTKEFVKMREEHRMRLFILRQQDRRLHERFIEAVFQPQTDTVRINVIVDSIAAVRKEMELITFQHVMRLKTVLNPAQQDKFRYIFIKALDKMLPSQEEPPLPPGDRKNSSDHR
jgi:Spy/CpxP family protein refolding chaperone